jgi:hypothetical protein
MLRFIALSDPTWCHKRLGLPKDTPLISLAGFMRFWGYVFIVTTIVIWLFKDEERARSFFSFSVRKSTDQLSSYSSSTHPCKVPRTPEKASDGAGSEHDETKDDLCGDAVNGTCSLDADSPSVSETCRQILAIFRLKPVQTLAFMLLTFKVAFAPADAVATFKLQVCFFSYQIT